MVPEIAKRCESCGAAIRVHAVFCPQCGVPLRREPGKNEQAGDTRGGAIEVPETRLKELDDQLKTKSMGPVNVEHEGQAQADRLLDTMAGPLPTDAPPEEPVPAKVNAAAPDGGRSAVASETRAGDASANRRHRVAAAAREAARENLRPRVEKFKQTSAVVLDEAAEDPSLRFVLVAAALVIISLVLLLLSLVR